MSERDDLAQDEAAGGGAARVCPECGEPDEGNDAHDGECSQAFPYLTPSELATYERLRPCFVELFKREAAGGERCTCEVTGECSYSMSGPTCWVEKCPPCQYPELDTDPNCPVHGEYHTPKEERDG